MRAAKSRGDLRHMRATLAGLTQAGHTPGVTVYMLLIAALAARGQPSAALAVLGDMRGAGVSPDPPCYNAIINAFCEAGQMVDAQRIANEMAAAGCSPDCSTYNTLIKVWGPVDVAPQLLSQQGHAMARQPGEAVEVLAAMLARGGDVRPNIRTYNTLLNLWCEAGNIEEARRIMAAMRKAGIQPDVVSYNTLLKAYGLLRRPADAERVMREMQNAYVQPNERTYGLAVRAYCNAGHLDSATALVERMRGAGLVPNAAIFNTLIKGYTRDLRPADAQKVLVAMVSCGVQPDVASYSTIVDAWGTAGLPERAAAVFKSMRDAGVTPDVEAYSVLVKAYVRARRMADAEAVLADMTACGRPPNVVTYTTLLSGWCSCGGMEDAMAVLGSMQAAGVRPNVLTFQHLLWGFAERKQPERAQELLAAMDAAGVVPDAKCFDLITTAWHSVGRADEAHQVADLKMLRGLASGTGPGQKSSGRLPPKVHQPLPQPGSFPFVRKEGSPAAGNKHGKGQRSGGSWNMVGCQSEVRPRRCTCLTRLDVREVASTTASVGSQQSSATASMGPVALHLLECSARADLLAVGSVHGAAARQCGAGLGREAAALIDPSGLLWQHRAPVLLRSPFLQQASVALCWHRRPLSLHPCTIRLRGRPSNTWHLAARLPSPL
eukprot:SM000034S12671  [mRNA]  locus=s34:170727:173800:+ [translate_table: standard]